MQENTENKIEQNIRRQAVKKLHRDIHDRYRLENIREIAGDEIQDALCGITQEDIEPLQTLFFNTVYPEVDARQRRDKSFESMIAMLKAPARLTRIIPSLPMIIIRYATIWPTALNVGLNAMLAYLQSVRLENNLVKEIYNVLEDKDIQIDQDYALDEETYRAAYRRVPYTDGRKMIGHAMKVIRAGRDLRMVGATFNILCDVQKTLVAADKPRVAAGHPPVYADAITAIDFGKDTLQDRPCNCH